MINREPAFFFDTADAEFVAAAWKRLSPVFPAAAVRGITTNPSAISKMGIQTLEALKRQVEALCKASSQMRPDGKGVVYVQMPNSAMTGERIEAWAEFLLGLGDGKTPVGMKIAPFPVALEAGRKLAKRIEINVTGVADCATALRAFSYGPRYVSIIPGRMEEAGIDARAHIHFVQQRARDAGEVIAGSMRTIEGLKWTCEIGTVPTIGSRVWEQLFAQDQVEDFKGFWGGAGPQADTPFAPSNGQANYDLSKAFFEQMDGLAAPLHREFSGWPAQA